MTIHYHGTPITPLEVLYSLAGRHFCVSWFRPEQVEKAHQIGQSVMLDNGAFSLWMADRRAGTAEWREPDWTPYYDWCGRWLEYPTTWAVIPDLIDQGENFQEYLIGEWPFGHRGAPVWHMDERIDRLLRLTDTWPRVCIGSTKQYAVVGSEPWHRRIIEAFNEVSRRHQRLPWLHMLRGMQLAGSAYPFASVDSTDIGRNHNRPQNTARAMADRWDAMQCPGRWSPRPTQPDLLAAG